jgi:hypothetical protein
VSEDLAVTRGGPKAPVDAAPRRAAGSVRRTSTIDSMRPDGLDGDVQVVARARDLLTTDDGTARVLAADGYDAVVSADRRLLHIDHPDTRLADLQGGTTASGFRARAVAAVPDEAERSTLLNLLLDDLTGANLVAGYAMQRHPSWTTRTIPAEHFDAVTDLCAGWARDATILVGVEADGLVPTPTTAPVAGDPGDDDPFAWHQRPALPPGSMRRARRLDVVADGGGVGVRFDVHFRDSYVDRDGVEGAVHEYSVWGRFDPSSHTVVEIDAAAHVLPWVECPQALGSAARLVGATVDELRAVVRADFVGTSTCTHLNDTLRGLADLPALAALTAV